MGESGLGIDERQDGHETVLVEVVVGHDGGVPVEVGGAGGPGVRRWDAAADDAHLQNITDFVFDAFGRDSIRAMWLVGHSQGGFTSRRIVCSDYFKGKVDGWVSPPDGPGLGVEVDTDSLRLVATYTEANNRPMYYRPDGSPITW